MRALGKHRRNGAVFRRNGHEGRAVFRVRPDRVRPDERGIPMSPRGSGSPRRAKPLHSFLNMR